MAQAAECEEWAKRQVRVTGPVDPAFERPWAAVWRVPTDGGPAWLKVCGPAQDFEPRPTSVLAGRWPDRLPRVLAHDPERGLLLLADAGKQLGIGGDPARWLAVLPAYAELQRGEAAHVEAHLAAGVPDRRLARWPELLDALLALDLPLGAAEEERLRSFGQRLGELCAELECAGIPETSQHDDLHGNNLFVDGSATRILDWGDSCISHPFLSFRVTWVHLFLPTDDPWRARLRDAYLEPWGRPAELGDAFELAQRLAPLAHLFVHERLLRLSGDPTLASRLTDLAPTLVEALAAT